MHVATGILTALLAMTGTPALAAEPELLRIREAQVTLPAITAFVAVTDGNGMPTDAPPATAFVAALGSQSAAVGDVRPFDPSRDGVGYVFLVDVSRSLSPKQHDVLVRSLGEWVRTLGPHDRAAILTFGNEVRVVQDFSADRSLLAARVQALAATDDITQLHRGLLHAMKIARRSDAELPEYRVIVTLSDGRDDVVGGPTRQEVLDALRTQPVPIFALGLAPEGVRGAARDALSTFGEFARVSGGEYQSVAAGEIAASCGAVREQIVRVLRVRLQCERCRDSGAQRLELTWRSGGRRVSDGIQLYVDVTPVAPAPAATSAAEARGAPLAPPTGRTAPAIRWTPVVILVGILMVSIVGVARGRRGNSTLSASEARARRVRRIQRTRPQPDDGGHPILAGITGFFAGSEIELDEQTIVIGRDPETCQLVFPAEAAKIGRQHCSVRYDRRSETFVLVDGPSANGTFVGAGERLAPGASRRLRSGDGFHLVDPSTRFEVRIARRTAQEKNPR